MANVWSRMLGCFKKFYIALQRLTDELFSVTLSNVDRAKSIVLGFERLSARDVAHLTVMEDQSIARVLTFEDSFDEFPRVSRVSG